MNFEISLHRFQKLLEIFIVSTHNVIIVTWNFGPYLSICQRKIKENLLWLCYRLEYRMRLQYTQFLIYSSGLVFFYITKVVHVVHILFRIIYVFDMFSLIARYEWHKHKIDCFRFCEIWKCDEWILMFSFLTFINSRLFLIY